MKRTGHLQGFVYNQILLHRYNNFDSLGQVEDLMTALDVSENDAQIIQVKSL